jgi:hypothetical protein
MLYTQLDDEKWGVNCVHNGRTNTVVFFLSKEYFINPATGVTNMSCLWSKDIASNRYSNSMLTAVNNKSTKISL